MCGAVTADYSMHEQQITAMKIFMMINIGTLALLLLHLVPNYIKLEFIIYKYDDDNNSNNNNNK